MSTKSILAGLGLLAFSSTALSMPIPLPPGLIQLSDNNAESLINADGSDSSVDPILDVGDRLRGIFDINSVEGLNPATSAEFTPFGAAGNELVGMFDITVISKSGGPGAWSFQFVATGNLTTAGAAVEMFYDPSNNYTRLGCATEAACEATVTDGTLWAAFGFGANSFWSATTVTDDIGSVGSIQPPANGGTFNVGLDFLVNNTGYDYNEYECLATGSGLVNDMCASGSLLGTQGADTPFDSFSNVDFVLQRVPVPGTVLLLGLGLAGFGAMRRKS